jgi:hypothetical protein
MAFIYNERVEHATQTLYLEVGIKPTLSRFDVVG